jgi:glyoxylase-like metal-dependent hydrolase (beta-lactamase superfamily II)
MQLGPFTLTALSAGNFRLDGGAMHGVVPKTLWSKQVSCDADNRVEYATTCLLVERDGQRLLVETGNGAKLGDKARALYGIEHHRSIEQALAERDLAPEAIDRVVMTHLHFDHAGGATRLRASGGVEPVFRRARHVVQRAEWHDATHPHERNRASYLAEDFAPLEEAGLIDRVEGEVDVMPGVRVVPTPGHTPGHQSVLIDADGQRVLFLGDVVPTAVHVPLPWVMAYDLEPARTVETKRALWRRAVAEKWIVVFGHDTSCDAAVLEQDERGRVLVAKKIRLE